MVRSTGEAAERDGIPARRYSVVYEVFLGRPGAEGPRSVALTDAPSPRQAIRRVARELGCSHALEPSLFATGARSQWEFHCSALREDVGALMIRGVVTRLGSPAPAESWRRPSARSRAVPASNRVRSAWT